MKPAASEVEAELFDSYGTQSTHYARSLELIRGLPTDFSDGTDTHDTLQEINRELDHVARLESELANLKTEWQTHRLVPSDRLQERINGIQGLLEELLGQIAVAEQHAESAKQRLRPEIESSVQSTKMRNAYRQFTNK